MTIAIVDAYDDPNAEADLAVYRSTFGLPACTTANGCFSKVNQNGATSPLPSPNGGWAGEISLDIDMVSAICPNCHILLVESNDNNNNNIDVAEDTAYNMGAKAISNSFGGDESSGDPTECNEHYNHPGTAISVSSGDYGYGPQDPASCPGVTAVGGTSLVPSSNTRGWTETVWNTSDSEGAGSGCSQYESKPSWQTDVGCANRTIADVSAVADPGTGVALYNSYSDSGWAVYGGTSVASPLIGGVYGLAGVAGDNDVPAQYAYANQGAFYDITSGQTYSGCDSYLCKAGPGYDGPTGVGTPNGIVGFEPPVADDFTIWANPTGFTLAVGASNTTQVSTSVAAGSAETVALSLTGLPTGASYLFSPTSVTSGQASTLTINAGTAAPNTYSLSIVGTANSGNHSTDFSLKISSPSTTTLVGSSQNPSTYGQPVSFTATVSGKGTPTGSVQFVIDGTNFGAAVNLVNGSATSSAISSLTASTHTVSAVYTSDSLNFASGSGALVGGQAVSQATPSLSWANPASIMYGTPLGILQLNAISTISGNFAYSPGAGSVLSVGSHMLTATFTPADTQDYSVTQKQVSLMVNKETPTVTWNPAAVQLGSKLTSAQLNAVASIPGSFVYTPALGTVVTTTTEKVKAVFTPTNTAAHNSVTTTVSVPVGVISVSPASVNFGTVYLGSVTNKNVTVTNEGSNSITISNPVVSILTTGDSREFVADNLCPKTLAAHSSCTVLISYVAGAFYHQQSATLKVMDSSPGSPQQVSLTALTIDPQAEFSSSSLTFGSQKVASSSMARALTLQNPGATALTIEGLSITGSDPHDFLLTNHCGATLAAGANCTLEIVFKPAAKGSRKANLVLTDNAKADSTTVPLSGTGD